MKTIWALFLVAATAASLVVVGATQVLACSCIPARPDKVALEDSAAVFAGTLADVEDGVEIGFDPVTWTFAVDTVYKGDVGETQEVTSHTQSAACGLVFKEEKRYVVFAHEEAGELHTNICENTRAIGDGEELKLQALGEGKEIEPLVEDREAPSPNLTPMFAAAAAVFVITGLVFLALRRKRATN